MRLAGTAAVLGTLAGLLAGCGGDRPAVPPVPEATMTITVSSTAFPDGGDIPQRYTCDGANVSPPLAFGPVPAGTVELALLVTDPDAPGGTFVHWVAWGIDPARPALAEGQAPPGNGANGFGRQGYGGPCPPRGPAHRYVFTAYAVSRRLDLKTSASAEELTRAVQGAVLAQGRLTGRYRRA
jgi:Raf kinase inhibitor-like YbhB/YbcL family protein